MYRLAFSLVTVLVFSSTAIASNGLISVKSAYDVKQTANRLEAVLEKKGMTVFSRINHAAGAQKLGKSLRPTELVIFGNPKVGTPLMLCSQSIAIDLPQKALIWEDKDQQVWLSYNDPKYLTDRHAIKECKEVVKKIEGALGNFAKAATQP